MQTLEVPQTYAEVPAFKTLETPGFPATCRWCGQLLRYGQACNEAHAKLALTWHDAIFGE